MSMLWDEILKIHCRKCKIGLEHYHEKEQCLDFWQPTINDKVCWCGKVWAHHHKETTKILIPARNNKHG